MVAGVGNRREPVGSLGTKAEEDRLPGGLNHHSLTRSQCPGPRSQPSATQVLPDRSSRQSHPGRREAGEQDGIMPDGGAGRRAHQLAPAMCQLLAGLKEHRADRKDGGCLSNSGCPADRLRRALVSLVNTTEGEPVLGS